jgi:hypothetical protein
MPNPIRYDLAESSAVQFFMYDEGPNAARAALAALGRKWLARNLRISPGAVRVVEERIDRTAYLTFTMNPKTEDGGVLL